MKALPDLHAHAIKGHILLVLAFNKVSCMHNKRLSKTAIATANELMPCIAYDVLCPFGVWLSAWFVNLAGRALLGLEFCEDTSFVSNGLMGIRPT